MRATNSSLTAPQVQKIIVATARRVGDAPDGSPIRLLDVAKAVEVAKACGSPCRTTVAANDAYTMTRGSRLLVMADGVLDNDLMLSGQVQSVELSDLVPAEVITNLGGGGFSVDLRNNPTYTGTVRFSYVVHTDIGDSNVASVTVTVVER